MTQRQQRRGFLFRLPWLTGPAVPRPTQPQGPRPTVATQASVEQTSPPPFRSAGIAPTQLSPPQSRTESKPPSPSRVATPKVSSLPSSPSRAVNGVRSTSAQSPSPSRIQKQSRAASLPPTPSRPAPQTRPTSLPQSPSDEDSQSDLSIQTTSKTRPPSRLPFRLSSPSMKLQPTHQGSPQLSPSSKNLQSASQREEQEHALSDLELEETKSERIITPDVKLNSHIHDSVVSTPQPERILANPSQESGEETASDSESPNEASPLTKTSDHKSVPNSEEKSDKTKEGMKYVQEHRKEENNHSTYEEPKKKIISEEESFQRSNGKILSSPHQKNRGIHATPNSDKATLHREDKEDISKFVQKIESGFPKQSMNEKPVSMVTLAGENRGASLQLGSEPSKRERSVYIHRRYKVNADERGETSTDGEGTSKRGESENSTTKEDQARKVINSNIQGINNSLVFNSSITERDPGVHLSCNPAEPAKINGKTESLETHKSEFHVTPAERLTHEPRVRRRCLRGILMEPSDSEPDNPEKPRRHGCRYNCGEKNKDKEVNVS